MIKGSLDGSVSRVYMYYHGPMRAVLSDLSLKPVMSDAESVGTGRRIVFLPNEWTEVNYSDIREKWETGNSQLNHLEASGYLDIYTDPKDVAEMKELLKDFHLPDNLKHGQYIKAFEDKDIVKKYLEQKKQESDAEGFTMSPQHKYFDLDKGIGVAKYSGEHEKVGTIGSVDKSTDKFDNIVKLVEKQVEQSTKQAEQMTKMMETMQQMLVTMLSTQKKD